MNGKTVIPASYDAALSFTMTYDSPRIVALHDSDGNMYIAERLIHTSQVNNTFIHGLEPWGARLMGQHVLECFFRKQEGKIEEDPDKQKRLDTMDNFSFAVSKMVLKGTARPFCLVDISFDMHWTLDGELGECVTEIPFVRISKTQFDL